MAKRGPKKGESRWRWYVIRRDTDDKYYAGVSRSGERASPRFSSNPNDAMYYRVRPAMSVLCQLRRQQRIRERYFNYGTGREKRHRRRTFKPPVTFRLEVKDDPKAKVYYPWQMPT
jgi:hypothetical protein